MKITNKLILLTIIYCIGLSAYALDNCEDQKDQDHFYTSSLTSSPEDYYMDFFNKHIAKRSEDILSVLVCYSEVKKSEECQFAVESYREFTRDYYNKMIVSLMVMEKSNEVNHKSNPNLELEISQKNIDAYKYLYRKLNRIPTGMSVRKFSRVKLEEIAKLRDKHEKRYFQIINTWSFFQYIPKIEELDDEKLDVVILEALTRQYNSMQVSLDKFKDQNYENYLYTQSSLDFFLEKNSLINSEMCEYIDTIKEYISTKERNDLLINTVAPITLSIGACIVMTPAGCLITSLGLSVASTASDIYSNNKKLDYEIIKTNLTISTHKNVNEQRSIRNLSIYLAPLSLFEGYLGFRFLNKASR